MCLQYFRMAMATEVQSQISKRTSLDIGGNLAVNERSGGGAATAILRHQVSPVSSVELMGSMGLQSLVGIQTSRYDIVFRVLIIFSCLV